MVQKILLVIDMQTDFVDGALGTKEAVAMVDNVVAKIKQFDGDIIVTYDTHGENYLDTQEGKHLPVPHCIKGTNGWSLTPKVQDALAEKSYHAIEKPTFGSVELMEYLKQTYPNQTLDITLCGLCTDICVVSNALLLKATFLDAQVSVDASCCAGVTPESHKAALTTMQMCQVTIL